MYNCNLEIQKITRSTKYPSMESKSNKKISKTQSKKKKVKKNSYGILIVEDETLWKQLYQINLFQQTDQKRNFHFYEANNGREALKILAQYYDQIDVVIVDLVMEKMAGMELLKFIVDKWGLDLGIFMVTAHGSTKDMEEAQIRGVRAFIDKLQVDFKKLSYLIEAYLDLKEKDKGIDNGFYVEERIQPPPPEGDQKYVYVRWRHSDRSSETLYLGKAEEIETITLPNLRTNLEKFEIIGHQKKDKT